MGIYQIRTEDGQVTADQARVDQRERELVEGKDPGKWFTEVFLDKKRADRISKRLGECKTASENVKSKMPERGVIEKVTRKVDDLFSTMKILMGCLEKEFTVVDDVKCTGVGERYYLRQLNWPPFRSGNKAEGHFCWCHKSIYDTLTPEALDSET